MKQYLLLMLIIVTCSACATAPMANVRPEWNPTHGYDWAVAQCVAKSPNTNTIALLFNGPRPYRACMAAYGYEPMKPGQEKKNLGTH